MSNERPIIKVNVAERTLSVEDRVITLDDALQRVFVGNLRAPHDPLKGMTLRYSGDIKPEEAKIREFFDNLPNRNPKIYAANYECGNPSLSFVEISAGHYIFSVTSE